jgi:fucose 4-O-acetylase-like acetyltransferase
VDGCKGLAIVLVVYGHVSGGYRTSGVLKADSFYLAARNWVYLFHMPAFFLLSGLFARRGLAYPFRHFLESRVRRLVYPYVLWTGIYFAAQEVMTRFVNNPPDPGRLARFLWEPYGYGLWFLYSLLLISLLYYGLQLAKLPKLAILLGALGLHLAAWFDVFGFWPIFNTAMFNFIFYAMGGLYMDRIFILIEKPGMPLSIVAGILLLGLMTGLYLVLGRFALPLAVVFALPGIIGLALLARGIAHFSGAASVLGFYSLEIYLGHPLFSIGARAVLGRIGIHSPTIGIAVCVLAGVLLSLLLAMACNKRKFPYLFRIPDKKTKQEDETGASSRS